MRQSPVFLPFLLIALGASITAPLAPAADAPSNRGTSRAPADLGPTCRLVTPAEVGPGARRQALRIDFARDSADVPANGTVVVGPASIQTAAGDTLVGGERYLCVITIRNRRQDATTFDLRPIGLLGSAGDGGVEYVDAGEPSAARTAVTWIAPAVPAVTIPVRGVARVPVRLTVPAGPPDGAVFGAVDVVPRVRTSATGTDGAPAVGIESRVQVAFLLATGPEARGARLRLEREDAPRLRWARDAWPWHAQLHSDGPSFATPAGRVRVRSIFGSTVAQLPLATRPLLPGGAAPVEVEWSRVPWFGIYRYDVRVGTGDPAGRAAQSTGWFVALPPWWVLAVITLGLLGAALRWLVPRIRRNLPEHRDHVDASAWADGFSSLD